MGHRSIPYLNSSAAKLTRSAKLLMNALPSANHVVLSAISKFFASRFRAVTICWCAIAMSIAGLAFDSGKPKHATARRVGSARSAATQHLNSRRIQSVGYAPSALTHPTRCAALHRASPRTPRYPPGGVSLPTAVSSLFVAPMRSDSSVSSTSRRPSYSARFLSLCAFRNVWMSAALVPSV